MASSPSSEEITKLAYSKKWLNLYYYDKSNSGEYYSKASQTNFFFSGRAGKSDPVGELTAALVAYNSQSDKKWGHVKKIAQCAFPARYKVIQDQWPKLFPRKFECKELKDWLKSIDAKKLYIVYAGAYPNNPASMFGHTFLRFSKNDENQREG